MAETKKKKGEKEKKSTGAKKTAKKNGVVLTRTSREDKKKKKQKILTGIAIYAAVFILLLFSQYSTLFGVPGDFIKKFFLGVFGNVSYIFPFIMVYDFIYYFKQKKINGSMVKVYSTIVAVFDLSAIFHLISAGREKMAIDIGILYNGGINYTHTGGIVGGFLGETFKYIGYSPALCVLFLMLGVLAFIILYEPCVAFIEFAFGYVYSLKKPDIPHHERVEREKPEKEKKHRREKEYEPAKSDAEEGTGTDFGKLMEAHKTFSDGENGLGSGDLTDAENRVFEEKDRLDRILSGFAEKNNVKENEAEEELFTGKVTEVPGVTAGAVVQPVRSEPTVGEGGEPELPEDDIPEKEIPENRIIEYKFPSVELLDDNKAAKGTSPKDIEALKVNARKLEEILRSFGVKAEVVNIEKGPAITRYELQPASGVRVTKIIGLQDDIKMNLAATSIRIAPIPGKTVIGVEVPNEDVTPVCIKELVSSDKFSGHKSKLAFTVGMDITGNPVIGDIAKMPHVLIAGATGSGKSVCINSLVTSILYKANPNEVKLILIDPKVVELGIYNGIPHLLIPVVTDPKKAAGALNWAVMEMQNRYKLFAEYEVRNIQGYNEYITENGEENKFMPQIVIIIDELADLMMVAAKDVENYICRLAQLARAAGIHLVIATQRPSVNVITGLIKANVPSRIAFAVTSQIDSRTILDMGGAEKLLGRGDMLYHPMGATKPIRVQGTLVTDKEVERVVNVVKANATAIYDEDILEHLENVETGDEGGGRESEGGEADEMLPQAIDVVMETGQASTSLLQRRLKLGYARAARVMDQMEARGIVGPSEGSKPRQILITREQYYEMKVNN